MTIEQFLEKVQSIVNEHPTYRLGGDGSDGTCDCIGLIIGAIRRAGGSWTGTHGSNYAARNEMDYLSPVTSEDVLQLGDLVYKSREPGEKDYDLPDKYANHFDQRDYYHVGVVTGVNPLKITHCTSASDANGILIDQKLGQWSWHGCLTKIDGKEPNPSTSVQAVVTADSGRTVNLRKSPSKSATVLERVPIGDVVEVTNENGEWCAVKYKGMSGYMMSCFLYFGDIANDMIFVSAGELAKLSSALNDAIAAVNEMMNGGVG